MGEDARGPADAGGETPLDARRRQAFAMHITAALEARNLDYAVLRDPSRLFDAGRGDLDLWVPSRSIDAIEDVVLAEAESADWWVIKRVRRPYVVSLYLYAPGSPPSALTIDLFPAIRWVLADLIREGDLARARHRDRGIWLIDPSVSALASCLHHLAWNGSVPARYLETFRSSVPVESPHTPLVSELAHDPHPDWAIYRRRLLSRALVSALTRHPIRSAGWAGSTVLSLIRSPRGRWVNLEGNRGHRCLPEIDRQLHDEHFLVGRWGSVGEIPSGRVHRALWNMKVLVKRRLGAVLLSAGSFRVVGPDLRMPDPKRPVGDGEETGATSTASCVEQARLLVTWLAGELRLPVDRDR